MIPEPLPRPEPVLDAQTVTRNVLGLVGGISALASLFGFSFALTDNGQEVVATVVAAIFSLATLVAGLLVPMIQAKKARDLVTPIADPRGADGTPLVPAVE